MSESQESFRHNHGENIRLMWIAANRARQAGKPEEADEIESIIESWERIAEKAGRRDA